MSKSWLTVVAPASVESWFGRFTHNDGQVVFIGEEPDDPVALADRLEAWAAGRGIRIHSGHDSLLRDWVTSRILRQRAVTVESQSGIAAAAGGDKLLQKRLLALADISTPEWGESERDVAPSDKLLVKLRSGTQSRGLYWARSGAALPANSYWEAYVAGTEYSVVLHCASNGHTVLPPVWKGRVREDLLPPWRRLRLVPSGLSPTEARALQVTAVAIADLLEAWGFIEIEFIVPDDAPPLVTDINPRVCGTMRIAGMACEIPLFDLADQVQSENCYLTPSRFAAEVPYEGAAFADVDVIATSRLTCAANSADDIRSILASRGYPASALSNAGGWIAN